MKFLPISSRDRTPLVSSSPTARLTVYRETPRASAILVIVAWATLSASMRSTRNSATPLAAKLRSERAQIGSVSGRVSTREDPRAGRGSAAGIAEGSDCSFARVVLVACPCGELRG